MQIILVEQTIIYDVRIEDKFYTLYVTDENDVYRYELVNEDGDEVTDAELLDEILDELNDMPVRF